MEEAAGPVVWRTPADCALAGGASRPKASRAKIKDENVASCGFLEPRRALRMKVSNLDLEATVAKKSLANYTRSGDGRECDTLQSVITAKVRRRRLLPEKTEKRWYMEVGQSF